MSKAYNLRVFSETVETARKRKGLTQPELAERLGLRQQTISKWEKGQARPRSGFVKEVAAELDLSEHDLLVMAGYLAGDKRKSGATLRAQAERRFTGRRAADPDIERMNSKLDQLIELMSELSSTLQADPPAPPRSNGPR